MDDILNVGLGFIEGFALIISPCILPILPIILAGSLMGSKKRPFGIISGFVIIFTLVTYFSRLLVLYSGIDLNFIRHISFGILFFLGLVMLSSHLTEIFSRLTQRLANVGSTFSIANDPQGGFVGGMLFGGILAIIWTPCAGPILAAVIVQTVIQQTTILSFLTLLAFGLGVAIPMLGIAFFGRALIEKLSYFKSHASFFRKLLGIVILLSVGYMVYLEKGIRLFHATEPARASSSTLPLQNALPTPYAAPEIGGIDAWINSGPLSLNNLRGKVVLIDFWTYSCINCVRTLPYLRSWYNHYHAKGLVIIGIHTPEFEFEKNLTNVKNAVQQYGIPYPVALDNHFVTWLNFNNRYWPAHYLIDQEGKVVYVHFGEGDDDITENNIRYLLGLNKNLPTKRAIEIRSSINQTPETYLGNARADLFASPQTILKDQATHYTFPDPLIQHHWALQGEWKILSDRIVAEQKNAAIKIHFHARNVFIVMGSAEQQNIQVKLHLDGKSGMVEKRITVKQHTLYPIVALDQPSDGVLEIIADAPGLEMYTFTFG